MKKTFSTFMAILSLASYTAFSEDIATITDSVSEGLSSFASSVLVAIPEAATQQNVWEDAYIGQLIGLPPNLGGGISFGATQLNMSGLKQAGEGLENITGVDIQSIPDSFALPVISADIRIGGILFPFDIGISGMTTNFGLYNTDLSLPSNVLSMSSGKKFSLLGYDGTFDYMAFGLDLRYCIFKETKILPMISLGGGYFFTKGQFAVTGVTTKSIDLTSLGYDTVSAQMTANEGLGFESHVLFIQAQVSKQIGIVHIYGGARGLISNTTTTWAWNYSTDFGDDEINAATADDESYNGEDSGYVATGSGSENSSWDLNSFQPQFYAGLGCDFLVFTASVGVCADVRSLGTAITTSDIKNFAWSGSASLRVSF